jgi:hypothetical protein
MNTARKSTIDKETAMTTRPGESTDLACLLLLDRLLLDSIVKMKTSLLNATETELLMSFGAFSCTPVNVL